MADLVLGAGGAGEAAYTIDQSLRFNAADSPYLSKTFGSAGNQKTWTVSFWMKQSEPTFDCHILNAYTGVDSDAGFLQLNITESGHFRSGGWSTTNRVSTDFFRDSGSWYHFVVNFDTTEGTAVDRMKVYVNNRLITDWGTNNAFTENTNYPINSASAHQIGRDNAISGGGQFAGYFADYYFIDGTIYAPSDFGETDEDTNQWKPKDASGLTFGTNGFLLKFEDSADLGNDSSGEGNDWTVNNLVATDQMVDSPTNNFSTPNPLDNNGITLTEGNLKGTGLTGPWSEVRGSIGVSSGKWYWEVLYVSESESACWVAGIRGTEGALAQFHWYSVSWSTATNGYNYGLLTDGAKVSSGTYTASFTSALSTGDIIGFALDLDSGTTTLDVYVNNSSAGTMYSGLQAGQTWTPGLSLCDPVGASVSVAVINLGSDSSFAAEKTAQGNADGNGKGDFYYAPPSGYLALCTSNLDAPSITLPGDNFNTVLYTGDGATTLAVTGAGFAPDFTWIKNRSASDEHILVDVARGANNYLRSDSTALQVDDNTVVASLDSDGFTVGDNVIVNTNTENYVSWNWLAGGSAVANTTGTVDAVVSANTTAGFSIVKFDQEGTGGDATIGHGLSQRPELVIGKPYDAADNWRVGCDFIASTVDWGEILLLNLANAAYTKTSVFDGGDFSGGPTASIIYMGSDGINNTGYESILYCFHSVDGYSKVGSYEGNGEAEPNGPFVYCGFRPAWVMIKGVEVGSRNWMMYDNKRSTYNVVGDFLEADTSDAETTGSAEDLDFVSNGFKIISDLGQINDTRKCLFLAFAEAPFKYANAR